MNRQYLVDPPDPPLSMIVAQVTDPMLRRAIRRAAHPEEDVIFDGRLGSDALIAGSPRLYVTDGRVLPGVQTSGLPMVRLDAATLQRWEIERSGSELPLTRVDFAAMRLSAAFEPENRIPSWVDSALADLSKASGAQLPGPLRAFARRILEFPLHYRTLHPIAAWSGLSRGALKAKFRRRSLPTPSTYLRWFRIMAVANRLSDRSVTIAAAARNLGFTSDGNLCRMVVDVTRMTPTEIRTVRGWKRLLISFAWENLQAEALEGWADLDGLFVAGSERRRG